MPEIDSPHIQSERTRSLPPELELVLICTRSQFRSEHLDGIRQLLAAGVRWNSVLAHAKEHSVLPFLAWNIHHHCRKDVPVEVLEKLRTAFLSNTRFTICLSSELIKVLKVLQSAGVTALALKGAALEAALYGDLSLRQFSDVDVLIRPTDFVAAREVLSKAGYRPIAGSEMWPGAAFITAATPVYSVDSPNGSLVELHWALAPPYNPVDFGMGELFDRSTTVQLGGRQIRTLGLEDLVLVLAVHGSRHVWARLGWVADFAELLRMPHIDWQTVAVRARCLRIERLLSVAVGVAERLLQAPVPQELFNVCRGDNQVSVLVDAACRNTLARLPKFGACEKESLRYYWLQNRLRESWRDRCRFLIQVPWLLRQVGKLGRVCAAPFQQQFRSGATTSISTESSRCRPPSFSREVPGRC